MLACSGSYRCGIIIYFFIPCLCVKKLIGSFSLNRIISGPCKKSFGLILLGLGIIIIFDIEFLDEYILKTFQGWSNREKFYR